MAAPVKAVFFDIGGVLLRFDLGGLLKEIAWARGASAWKVAKMVWSRKLIDEVERGRLDGPDLLEAIQQETGYEGGFEDFRRAWNGHFRLDQQVAALFRRAARRGPAFLLSNTNPLHWDHIRRRYAFAREATGAVLSHEVGARKPERAIYDAAVKLAGCAASECAFFDDLKENVAGAKAAGLRAFLYKDAARLEKDLSQLGIL